MTMLSAEFNAAMAGMRMIRYSYARFGDKLVPNMEGTVLPAS